MITTKSENKEENNNGDSSNYSNISENKTTTDLNKKTIKVKKNSNISIERRKRDKNEIGINL